LLDFFFRYFFFFFLLDFFFRPVFFFPAPKKNHPPARTRAVPAPQKFRPEREKIPRGAIFLWSQDFFPPLLAALDHPTGFLSARCTRSWVQEFFSDRREFLGTEK
jgi:hypothetical protein